MVLHPLDCDCSLNWDRFQVMTLYCCSMTEWGALLPRHCCTSDTAVVSKKPLFRILDLQSLKQWIIRAFASENQLVVASRHIEILSIYEFNLFIIASILLCQIATCLTLTLDAFIIIFFQGNFHVKRYSILPSRHVICDFHSALNSILYPNTVPNLYI